jgi:hypothetical protein
MTNDSYRPGDRFDPQTGQPIEYPSEPVGNNGIAAPGTVHSDYERSRLVTEPRDVVLSDPQVRAISAQMTPAQRIAAKARARDNALISVALPDLGESVKVMPKRFDLVLGDVGLSGTLSRSAQTSMMQALKEIDALPPDERVRLGEDMDVFARKIGIGGAIELQRALFSTYPVACMVEPRCVPTAADFTDEREEIALEWLSQADRNAIVNACMMEQGARAAAVAPFPNAQATA